MSTASRPPAIRPAKGRFAPSPTGAQHLGNARTYLAAYWSGLRREARMVLRIEDIDSPRVKPWAARQAVDDLRWLGIEWHEGFGIGGPESSYVQTERSRQYSHAVDRLRDAGRVFPCTCTRKDITAAASAPHAGDGQIVYPGTCAGWSEGDPLPREAYCWRYRVSSGSVTFVDEVAGRQSCQIAAELGDFPITRKSGEAAYQLAVVVDDAAMGVDEVVRGNDLIPSTFWQCDLYAALQFERPSFAHVPLVIGDDGRRLAKRHGDTRLSHLREQGVAPEDVVRWAAESFGHSPPSRLGSLGQLHEWVAAHWSWSDLPPDDVVVPAGWTC